MIGKNIDDIQDKVKKKKVDKELGSPYQKGNDMVISAEYNPPLKRQKKSKSPKSKKNDAAIIDKHYLSLKRKKKVSKSRKRTILAKLGQSCFEINLSDR